MIKRLDDVGHDDVRVVQHVGILFSWVIYYQHEHVAYL